MYSLDHIVGVGETETTCKLETFPGGKGLNQSIAVAKAGAKIYHAGCVGCDGDMLIDILLKNGVDISYISKTDEKNGHAIIQVSIEGEKMQYCCKKTLKHRFIYRENRGRRRIRK